jgi:hypothetical protein
MSMYHEGQRELQDRYRGRAVADRLEEHRMHRTFTDTDRTSSRHRVSSFLRLRGEGVSTAP